LDRIKFTAIALILNSMAQEEDSKNIVKRSEYKRNPEDINIYFF